MSGVASAVAAGAASAPAPLPRRWPQRARRLQPARPLQLALAQRARARSQAASAAAAEDTGGGAGVVAEPRPRRAARIPRGASASDGPPPARNAERTRPGGIFGPKDTHPAAFEADPQFSAFPLLNALSGEELREAGVGQRHRLGPRHARLACGGRGPAGHAEEGSDGAAPARDGGGEASGSTADSGSSAGSGGRARAGPPPLSLEQRLLWALAARNAVDAKEAYEAFEFVARVRRRLRRQLLFDLACGHGLAGVLLAALEPSVESVVLVDARRPPAFDAVLAAICEVAPWTAAKVRHTTADVAALAAEAAAGGAGLWGLLLPLPPPPAAGLGGAVPESHPDLAAHPGDAGPCSAALPAAVGAVAAAAVATTHEVREHASIKPNVQKIDGNIPARIDPDLGVLLVHACGALTDAGLLLACAAGASAVAALPCCYSGTAHGAPFGVRRALGVGLAADVDRAYRLQAAGFASVDFTAIPAAVSPMNRILIATRP